MLNHILFLNSKVLHLNVTNEIFTKNTAFRGLPEGCFIAPSDRPRGHKSATGPDSKHRIRQMGPPGASGVSVTTRRRAQPTPYLINTF
jgi:hypothetical protein